MDKLRAKEYRDENGKCRGAGFKHRPNECVGYIPDGHDDCLWYGGGKCQRTAGAIERHAERYFK